MRASAITLLIVAAIGTATLAAADPPQQKARVDVRKNLVIELPTKNLVKNSADLENALKKAELDMTKGKRVEAPIKQLVSAAATPAVTYETATPVANNPKVTPGKVRWHAGFDEACRASRESGKPVLLFQMMGNLDDRFC